MLHWHKKYIPDMKRITGYTVVSRLCKINLSAYRPEVRPETSTQANEIAVGKAAHLMASAEIEKLHVFRRNLLNIDVMGDGRHILVCW